MYQYDANKIVFISLNVSLPTVDTTTCSLRRDPMPLPWKRHFMPSCGEDNDTRCFYRRVYQSRHVYPVGCDSKPTCGCSVMMLYLRCCCCCCWCEWRQFAWRSTVDVVHHYGASFLHDYLLYSSHSCAVSHSNVAVCPTVFSWLVYCNCVWSTGKYYLKRF